MDTHDCLAAKMDLETRGKLLYKFDTVFYVAKLLLYLFIQM